MKGPKIKSDRLEELMDRRHLTQTELAEKIGMSRANISRILKSKESNVHKETLYTLSAFFNCSEEYLQGKVDHPNWVISNGKALPGVLRAISFERERILIERVRKLSRRNLEMLELIVDSLEYSNTDELELLRLIVDSLKRLNTDELDIVKAFFKALNEEYNF